MIDETHSTESSPAPNSEAPEELEELTVDDTDLDLEAAFGDGSSDAGSAGEAETPTQDSGDAVAIAALEGQITALKAQLDDRNSQYVRIAADFENFRRRTARERDDLEVQFKSNVIGELLPVIDNFERARSQIKPQTDAEMAIHKSYQGVYKQLVDCLKRLGVSAMRAEGQEFDPNYHEAVMREATDQYPEGVVMEELVRGYLLGEKVLRHAMVKVAAPPEPDMSPEAGDAAAAEASDT
ncbi:MAG: nucleotide exchange factor GrpE [Leptolyngbya sp.]|nr:nucleotide exchange factor GrpE [Leptolyngbya sp.]